MSYVNLMYAHSMILKTNNAACRCGQNYKNVWEIEKIALLTALFYLLVPMHCVLEHLTNRHLCRLRVLSCVVLITL